ncbi:MAG: CPBP family intramembrane glutamic endopeptidase [Promethearchaeota archaeon]
MSISIQKEKISQEKSFKELYHISKIVFWESFLEGNLESQGPQKERFIEKIKKNKKSFKRNAAGMKVLSAFYMLLLNLSMIVTLREFQEQIVHVNAQNFHSALFAISSSIAIMFIMQLVFFFMFGMAFFIGFFGGKSFKWLETLPLSQKEIKKIILITFLRSMDIQFITLLLGFPVFTLIFTGGNIIATLTAFFINILHIMVCLVFIFVMSKFMVQKVFILSGTSKAKTVVRVLVIVLYMVAAMSFSLILNLLDDYINSLFSQTGAGLLSPWITFILTLTIYPFSLTYFYSLSLFPLEKMYLQFSWPVIVGIILAIIVIILFFKKASKILLTVTKEIEIDSDRKSGAEQLPITVKIAQPTSAICSKDMKYITRNFSVLMYLILPIMYPLFISIFPIVFSNQSFETMSIFNILQFIYIGLSLVFLIIATTGSETETGGLIQTLPVKQSDIYKGKRKIILSVMLLSLVIPFILLVIKMPGMIHIILINFGSYALITFYEAELILILYAGFFGKIRGKYTIQMINSRNKVGKAIGGILIIYLAAYLPIIATAVLEAFSDFGPVFVYLFQLVLCTFIFIPIRVIAHRMLNWDGKKSKILDKPVISVAIMLFVYFGFLILPSFFIAGIIRSSIALNIINFILTFSMLGLLFLFIVPYGFEFPQKTQSFKDYIDTIKLSKIRPIGKNIVLGIVTSFSILLSTMLVLISISGNFVFDINQILPPTSWSLMLMLIPGIFEEIAFRGIILPMMLKKFSKRNAVFLNSVLFGVFHFVNLVSYAIIGILTFELFISVCFQVLYASVLGFYFGYLYLKMGSLLPCILSHYLLDAFFPLFQYTGPDATINVILSLYVFFLGVILPGLINLLIIYGLDKFWKRKKKKSREL